MKTMDTLHSPIGKWITISLASFALALLTGLAFAGWLNHGAEIFMSYSASGLAWCL